MQVHPFYSLLIDASEVCWHDNSTCPVGDLIVLVDRQPGTTDGLRHCPYCAQLNQPLRQACTPPGEVAVVSLPSTR